MVERQLQEGDSQTAQLFLKGLYEVLGNHLETGEC